MSNEIVEELVCIAKLLEQLPKRICDEMEQREALRKEMQIKDIQKQIEFYSTNINEINKMMYGYQIDKVDNNHE